MITTYIQCIIEMKMVSLTDSYLDLQVCIFWMPCLLLIIITQIHQSRTLWLLQPKSLIIYFHHVCSRDMRLHKKHLKISHLIAKYLITIKISNISVFTLLWWRPRLKNIIVVKKVNYYVMFMFQRNIQESYMYIIMHLLLLDIFHF